MCNPQLQKQAMGSPDAQNAMQNGVPPAALQALAQTGGKQLPNGQATIKKK